jgi:hypothetical protein
MIASSSTGITRAVIMFARRLDAGLGGISATMCGCRDGHRAACTGWVLRWCRVRDAGSRGVEHVASGCAVCTREANSVLVGVRGDAVSQGRGCRCHGFHVAIDGGALALTMALAATATADRRQEDSLGSRQTCRPHPIRSSVNFQNIHDISNLSSLT